MSKNPVKALDLTSVDWVLNTTRSVRQRLDLERPVPTALIDEALNIALQAPPGPTPKRGAFWSLPTPRLKAK